MLDDEQRDLFDSLENDVPSPITATKEFQDGKATFKEDKARYDAADEITMQLEHEVTEWLFKAATQKRSGTVLEGVNVGKAGDYYISGNGRIVFDFDKTEYTLGDFIVPPSEH